MKNEDILVFLQMTQNRILGHIITLCKCLVHPPTRIMFDKRLSNLSHKTLLYIDLLHSISDNICIYKGSNQNLLLASMLLNKDKNENHYEKNIIDILDMKILFLNK